MKRCGSIFVTIILSATILFTSSCNSPIPSPSQATVGKVITCLGNIVLKLLATLPEGAEPLAISSLLADTGPVCLDAAVAAFTSSPSSSTEIDINEAKSTMVATKTIDITYLPNCTPKMKTYALYESFVSVPFQMIVGPSDQQEIFSSRPSGNLENERIAQQLFDQYSNQINQTITTGGNQRFYIFTPPFEQPTVHATIAINYLTGEARVSNNGTTDVLPWMFPVGFLTFYGYRTTYSSAELLSANCKQANTSANMVKAI